MSSITKKRTYSSTSSSPNKKQKHTTVHVSSSTVGNIQTYSIDSKPVVRVWSNLFTPEAADTYFTHWSTLSSLQHQQVRIMGKMVLQPRLTASQAAEGAKHYTYSGLTIEPTKMDGYMKALLAQVGAVHTDSKEPPNYALINYYRDGNDYISEHSDNEKGLDSSKSIISISFGQERDFVMYEHKKKKKDKDDTERRQPRRALITIKTGHGQVIEMLPGCQQLLTHAIRKAGPKQALKPRVNITLRYVV